MTKDASFTGLEIAVIGMAGRFPRAAGIDELWANVLAATECLTTFSDEELRQSGVDQATLADANFVKAGGVVEGADRFDAAFFGYSPREAALLDPQHRFFLETVWTALEHAGYAPGTFEVPVGVYGGVGLNDYFAKNVMAARVDVPAEMLHLANDRDFLTTRVSYKLNLAGPSLTVQTACSTSLVAVHMACQSLIAGECDMAAAGGVTIRLPQTSGYLYQEGGISSPDGHCRAFSAKAQGCVPGNGGAIVVLKRLADAIADGDCIHAVIKGSAINNDGAGKVGYTAPGVDGQVRVIRAALRVADVSAETIGYLEAHGTGTVLGDPIEIQAATQAFRQDTSQSQYCAVGSLKTNIGHLDAGAGVAGLIKAVLAVRDGVLPPSLHCDATNPAIDFHHSPFYVNTSRREWDGQSAPRRAGVSAFGIGGTNAHVIVEQPPAPSSNGAGALRQLLIVSAKNERALDQSCANLAAYLRSHPNARLDEVSFTLKHGRAAMPHRRAVVSDSAADAADRLAMRSVQPPSPSVAPRLAYMFPGQGSQYASMGRELYESEPVFRRSVDTASEIVRPMIGTDLRTFVAAAATEEANQRLRDTTLAQPAIFAVSYALAQLFASWGLPPAAMIGHSIGEYVAACVAGVFSLEDALSLVCERGRLMASVPAGSMMAVALSADEIRRILPPALSLAAINAPNLTVVAGPSADADAFARDMQRGGVDVRMLHTTRAFHSAAMDPVLDAFVHQFGKIQLHEPTVPYVSNVTGTWVTPRDAMDAAYWAKHLRQTVRFSEGLQTLLDLPGTVLLELGPGQTLTTLARRQARAGRTTIVVPTTRRAEEPGDHGVLLESLGALWTHGLEIDWRRVDATGKGRRQPLPTYPFQRERCWIDAVAVPAAGAASTRLDPTEWYSVPSWERLPDARPEPRVVAERSNGPLWVLFVDDFGLGEAVAARLQARGDLVVNVRAGDSYAHPLERVYHLGAGTASHYQDLFAELRTYGRDRVNVVHCWSVEPDHSVRRGRGHADRYQERGFYSVLFLAQALGDQSWLQSTHITVVSSNLHDVIGTETLCPEKATVIGPVKVIPLEYSGISCSQVDVMLPPAEGDGWRMLADEVCARLDQPTSDAVAIRGRHHWRSTLVPVRVTASDAAPLLKKQGVYLITGGLGGVGLTVAEHLARTVQARLVLVGREAAASPAGASNREQSVDVASAISSVSRHEPEIANRVSLAPMSLMPDLDRTLDRLCAAYALAFLERSGVDLRGGSRVNRRALAASCRVLPGFERLFDSMLGALEGNGVLTIEETSVRFSGRHDRLNAGEIRRDAVARYPQLSPVFELLDQCAGQFDRALTGEVPAIGLLFGAEHVGVFKKAVATIREHSYVPLCEALARDLLGQVADGNRQRSLRILEVGGGEGLLTEAILPVLEGKSVEYTFTDISRTFVMNAERRAAQQGRSMRFGVLDISRPPAAQGYSAESFDVVVAFNVIHATSSVEATLKHLHELLAPGGMIVLQESVRPERWVDFIWGLTDGWWAFEDESLRRTSPLLDITGWTQVLQAAGFELVTAFPNGSHARATDTGLVAARKAFPAAAVAPGGLNVHDDRSLAMAHRRAALSRLEQLGSEIEIIAADVADPVSMKMAIDRALDRFGTIHGVFHAALVLNDGAMQSKTRDAVETVFRPKITGTLVLKALCEPLGLDFFVMFSSLVSILGGRGQVDYCAASSFQDLLAQAERGRLARAVISINWGAWREVGKAFRAAVERGAMPEDALPNGMSPAEGVDALMRVLASGLPQVLVSPEDLSALKAERDGKASRDIDELHSKHESAAAPSGGPAISDTVDTAPRTETERVIAEIWQEILGVPQLGVQDNFFDLGGDSMISLQFIAKAKKAGLRFTNRQVFEHQTIAELAAVAADKS
jgi:acyl transferase domain-containing protein/SAM-dependent methyltransferase